VAQELGICKESLATWRKLHKEGKLTKEKQISSNPNKGRAFETSQGT
jgi:transposase